MADQAEKIKDLLRQLREAGAEVSDASDENQSVKNLRESSKVADDVIEKMDASPDAFTAWVAWSKAI